MLTLSRKPGERVRIGDGVVLEVVKITRGRISLRIVAPPELRVLRGELFDRQQERVQRQEARA